MKEVHTHARSVSVSNLLLLSGAVQEQFTILDGESSGTLILAVALGTLLVLGKLQVEPALGSTEGGKVDWAGGAESDETESLGGIAGGLGLGLAGAGGLGSGGGDTAEERGCEEGLELHVGGVLVVVD